MSRLTPDDARRILGLGPDATLETLRRRYRVLANRFHPDRFVTPGERAVATRRFQAFSEAHDVLKRTLVGAQPHGAPGPTEATPPPRRESPEADGEERVTAWDLFKPLTAKFPWLEEVVGFLLLPSLMIMAVLVMPVMLVVDHLDRWPKISNLLGWLSTHILPGIGSVLLSTSSRGGDSWWVAAGQAWFLVGGVLSIVLDVVAQAIGVWQLIRQPKTISLRQALKD